MLSRKYKRLCVNQLITNKDEKLWSESPQNSQSCSKIGTNPQCLINYSGVIIITQQKDWEKGKNPTIPLKNRIIGLYVTNENISRK